jgi:PKD repeat protein
VASFTASGTVGLGVSFDGRASHDTDRPFALGISGNGIVSYRWDFGDGSEAYGDTAYHAYALPGDYTVTLTVLDCQARKASVSHSVTVADAGDAELILNGDFSDPSKFTVATLNGGYHDCRSRGLGWIGFQFDRHSDGYAIANRSGNPGSLIQVVRDQWTRKGAHTLSLDLKNTEAAGPFPNVIKVMVYGVNGRFAINPQSDAGPGPLVAVPTQSTTLLKTDSLGGRPFDWKPFLWDVDLGQGYEYLIVRVWTRNESEAGDVVAVRDVSLLAGTTGILTANDAGFERVTIGYGQFRYNPTGSPWTFVGSSGISADGSGFTSDNPPSNSQVAFIQGTGKFSQLIPGWIAGTYTLSFLAAQRGTSNHGGQDFRVLVDGGEVGTFTPSGASYEPMITEPFPVTAGTHSVEFRGLNTAGGDNTAFVDEVQITMVSLPSIVAPDVPDAGFEAVAVGAGQFRYAPTGSPWAFVGGPTGGAGLAANNSPFTSGNPPAPDGSQVAFLQGHGSVSQSIPGWTAGSYSLKFKAAQRGNFNHGGQNFGVLIDGSAVGTFTPSGTSYQDYETSAFTVTAGSHTIEFRGLNTAGGDNTAFLDAVEIVPIPGSQS